MSSRFGTQRFLAATPGHTMMHRSNMRHAFTVHGSDVNQPGRFERQCVLRRALFVRRDTLGDTRHDAVISNAPQGCNCEPSGRVDRFTGSAQAANVALATGRDFYASLSRNSTTPAAAAARSRAQGDATAAGRVSGQLGPAVDLRPGQFEAFPRRLGWAPARPVFPDPINRTPDPRGLASKRNTAEPSRVVRPTSRTACPPVDGHPRRLTSLYPLGRCHAVAPRFFPRRAA